MLGFLGFSALIALSGILHIVFDYRHQANQKPSDLHATWLFKPLTMALVVLYMLWQGDLSSTPHQLLLAALLLSMVGDAFLMVPPYPVAPALGAFLIAHILYVVLFLDLQSFEMTGLWQAILALVLVWNTVVAWRLIPKMGALLIPGLIYFTAISLMVLTSANVMAQGLSGGLILFAGAMSFYFSDTALAFDRFGEPYPAAQGLVLSTYYLGQWLIVLGVLALV